MRIFLLLLTLFKTSLVFSQLESSHWFSAQDHRLVRPAGVTLGLPMPPVSAQYYATTRSSSVADAQGNLLFATNGYTIIDKNLNPMPALPMGTPFNAGGNKLGIQHIPNTRQYYVFYIIINNYPDPNSSSTLKYALVDMDLNAGKGDVVSYNNVLDTNMSGAFTLAQGDDPSTAWLITHKHATDSFYVYPVTSAGLGTPIKSRTGTAVPQEYIFKEMKTSFDGKKIAGFASRYYPGLFSTSINFLEVFDFNNITGTVTSKVRSRRASNFYSGSRAIEFSADNRLLYLIANTSVGGLQPCGFGSGSITQYNLCYTDSLEFTKLAYTTASTFNFCNVNISWNFAQMGADKKIHVPFASSIVSTIANGNRIGSYVNFTQNAYTIPGSGGFRSSPDQHHKLVEKAIKNNIVYDGGCFPQPIAFSITNDTITAAEWNFGDPASSNNTSAMLAPSHLFSAPGIYTVTVKLYNSANVLVETLTELVQSKDPSTRLLHQYPSDTSFCLGKSLTLSLPPVVNGLYYWYIVESDGSQNSYGTTNSINISGPGKYYVELRLNDCNGCVMKDSIDVTVLPKPNFGLGTDRNLCSGDSLQLICYDQDADLIWNTGATTHSIWVTQPGLYWAQAEYDNNGCPFRDSINITGVPAMQFTLPADTTLCNTQSLLLSPGITGSNYLWQNGSTASTLLVTQPGTYWVSITSMNGCSKKDSINVYYVNADGVNLGRDTTLCIGETLDLQVNVPNAQYNWNTGASSPSINVSSPGTYWVRVDNGSCVITDTIEVSFVSIPAFSLGADTTLCNNQVLQLNPGLTGASYQWQDGSSQPYYMVTQAGTYWVKISLLPGCEKRDTILINYATAPQVNLGADTALCIGNNLLLQAGSGGAQYNWNTGQTTPAINVINSGQYWVSVNNGVCVIKDTIQVTFDNPPVFSLGADTSLCNSSTLLLSPVITGAQYIWQNGSAGNSFSVTAPGWYWLQVKKGGCTVTDSILVNYYPATAVDIGADIRFCQGQSASITAPNGFLQYNWSTGSTAADIVVNQAGTYWLAATNSNNCVERDTLIVLPTYSLPTVNLGADADICAGDNKILTAGNNNNWLYNWSTGAITAAINVNTAGSYWVKVKDQNGCEKSDTMVIKNIVAVPANFLGNDEAICNYGQTTIRPSANFESYLWSTGQESGSISLNRPGKYWLKVTDANNCIGVDSINISIKECMSGLYIPSAFTPNQDSKNDYLRAMLFGNIHFFELSIYNRYGQLVFHTKDPSRGWDGHVKGIIQETSSFVWICRYRINNEPEKIEKGNFTLIR
ncbi:MAG: gliding motility-associated C-terminal domain-containing protein [Rhizobacter sp.]|nr:gliding motility-associated C-terminal domain-containing protein [Ferruginibacter sp.]